MNHYEIEENSPFILEPQYIPLADKILRENPGLPIILEGNTLRFDSYMVGEVQIEDLLLTIKPRNASFNLGVIFEMAAFVNASNMLTNIQIPGYGYNSSFGISSVSDNFYKAIRLLLQYGLTGNVFEYEETSMQVKGRIDFNNFNFPSIPYKGVSTISKSYSIDTSANQAIKSALLKLLQIEKNEQVRSHIFSLLRDFDSVQEYQGSLHILDDVLRTHYSPNPYYSVSLEYAILILRDLKLNFKNGGVNWFAFLENSNSLFEKYIFKILKTGLKEKIDKWDSPRQYATIRHNQREGYKFFSPDAIVDYDKTLSSARAVLDMKNKPFFPDKTELSELVDPADIYQLVFYCKRLKTNVGGLIYPTIADYEPIQLMVNDENNLTLYLLSVNMKESFDKRYTKLIKDVKKLFIYS